MNHYESIAPNADIILQSGFCSRQVASVYSTAQYTVSATVYKSSQLVAIMTSVFSIQFTHNVHHYPDLYSSR